MTDDINAPNRTTDCLCTLDGYGVCAISYGDPIVDGILESACDPNRIREYSMLKSYMDAWPVMLDVTRCYDSIAEALEYHMSLANISASIPPGDLIESGALFLITTLLINLI